jgi:hypothetical protein
MWPVAHLLALKAIGVRATQGFCVSFEISIGLSRSYSPPSQETYSTSIKVTNIQYT